MTIRNYPKYLSLFFSLSVSFNLIGQTECVIYGKINGIAGKEVRLNSVFEKIDSFRFNSDSFTIKERLEIPRVYLLFMENKGLIPLFIDSIPVYISGSYSLDNKQFSVTGSKDCNLFWENFKKINDLSILKNAQQVKRDYPGNVPHFFETPILDSIKNEFRSIILSDFFRTENKYLRNLLLTGVIRENDKDLVRLLGDKMMQKNISLDDFPDFKIYYNEVSGSSSQLEDLPMNIFGKPPFSLSFNDRQNGKYLLIDFWATWCQPCIRSHQILREFISRKSNVEIYGVVLDKEQDNARNFLAKNSEEIPGTQVIPADEFERNQISSELRINIFPTYLLLDSSGKLKMRRFGIDGLQEILSFLDAER